jgi:hypothetical protein
MLIVCSLCHRGYLLELLLTKLRYATLTMAEHQGVCVCVRIGPASMEVWDAWENHAHMWERFQSALLYTSGPSIESTVAGGGCVLCIKDS